jgi:O-antigen ligase
MADNGKWLFLQHSKIVKNILIVMCGVFLLLSTSRGSWLVALVGIVVAVFFQSQQRRKIFVAMLLMGCVLVGVLQTESGEKISEYFEMATDSERTLSQKTTGRFEQWMLFPKVLEDSPIWGVGPGLQKKAYADYSWVDKEVEHKKGEERVFHSIYMQVGVETGMVGLIVLTGFFTKLIFTGLWYRHVTGSIVPLFGIVGFMTIGISVVGMDGISGLFLGLAFLGTTIPPKKIMKETRTPPRISKFQGIPSGAS